MVLSASSRLIGGTLALLNSLSSSEPCFANLKNWDSVFHSRKMTTPAITSVAGVLFLIVIARKRLRFLVDLLELGIDDFLQREALDFDDHKKG